MMSPFDSAIFELFPLKNFCWLEENPEGPSNDIIISLQST